MHLFVCKHIMWDTHIHTHIYTYIHAHMRTLTHARAYTHIQTRTHIYTHLYIFLYHILMYLSADMSRVTHTFTHTHTHTNTHTHTHSYDEIIMWKTFINTCVSNNNFERSKYLTDSFEEKKLPFWYKFSLSKWRFYVTNRPSCHLQPHLLLLINPYKDSFFLIWEITCMTRETVVTSVDVVNTKLAFRVIDEESIQSLTELVQSLERIGVKIILKVKSRYETFEDLCRKSFEKPCSWLQTFSFVLSCLRDLQTKKESIISIRSFKTNCVHFSMSNNFISLNRYIKRDIYNHICVLAEVIVYIG